MIARTFIIVTFGMVFCLEAPVADELGKSENFVRFDVTQSGIERESPRNSDDLTGLGQPYRYGFRSAESLENLTVSVVQEFGFPIHFTPPIPPFSECDDQNVTASKNFQHFWTDYIPLDDQFLTTFSTTWDSIKISKNDNTYYRIRLVGCNFSPPDRIDARRAGSIDPGMSLWRPGANDPVDPMPTYSSSAYIRMIIRADIQYRGRKSGYTDSPGYVYSKIILDQIGDRIGKHLSENKDIKDLHIRE